jgi:F-type H+-transporting ATPase subunit delta
MTSRAAAARYARALFDVARKEADVEQVQRDVEAFAGLVRTNAALAQTFGNPAIPVAKKRAIVEALLARSGKIAPVVAKLLLLLASRDRLVLLPEMAAAYRERVLDHLQVVRGEVRSAIPLTPDRIKALERSLAIATGRRVMLDATVDPSIVGGVVTRLGSTVFDGSVTTQLEKLKETLIESGI